MNSLPFPGPNSRFQDTVFPKQLLSTPLGGGGAVGWSLHIFFNVLFLKKAEGFNPLVTGGMRDGWGNISTDIRLTRRFFRFDPSDLILRIILHRAPEVDSRTRHFTRSTIYNIAQSSLANMTSLGRT
jgi:hypothetical protein